VTSLTVAEIARTYQRPPRPLRRLLDQGAVPYTRNASNHRLVAPEHIPALLAAAPRPNKKRDARTLESTTNLNWQGHGACRDVDPELFFPDNPTTAREQTQAAKAVCLACPVLITCQDYALTNGEEWGVWGALTAREREQIRNPKAKDTETAKRPAA
jgi:WhiB family redox-sensing transcriptional regulator